MTAPSPPAPATELQALLEEHADLILAIELAAATAAVAGLVDQLVQIQRTIAATWIVMVGTLFDTPTPAQARQLADTLINQLRGVRVSVADSVMPHAQRAAATAQAQALAEVGADPDGMTPGVSPELERQIRRVDDAVQDKLDAAIQILQEQPPESWEDMTSVMSVANQARTTAERGAAWAVNAAANDAILTEATRLDAQVVWIAERDACVSCLRYSGETILAGGSFPIGLTYGAKPVKPWPDPQRLPGPPLHPNCRCRLMIYFGHDTAAATRALPQGWRSAHVTYPAALRREADRSILRGWSLPSESERVRLRAAERLLLRGVKAPKTVKDYARRAVRRGGWPSRRVPTPPP